MSISQLLKCSIVPYKEGKVQNERGQENKVTYLRILFNLHLKTRHHFTPIVYVHRSSTNLVASKCQNYVITGLFLKVFSIMNVSSVARILVVFKPLFGIQ